MPTTEDPSSEERVRLALDTYFQELQCAQIEFEQLWDAAARGGALPDQARAGRLLRHIAGRADLIETALAALRMLRATR